MKTAFAKVILLALTALAGAWIVQGCGSKSNPMTSNNNPPPSSSHFHSISIQGFAFSPASLTIAVGDTVKWTNHDSAAHTATSDTGSELASSQLASGQTYQHVFLAGGTFAYHCAVHASMHGSVKAQ